MVRFDEARSWLERALELGSDSSAAARAGTLKALGAMWLMQQKPDKTLACCNQAIDLFRRLADSEGLALSLRLSALAEQTNGSLSNARARLDEALTLVERFRPSAWVAAFHGILLSDLGKIALDEGAVDQAERYYTEALGWLRAEGDGEDGSHPVAFEPRCGLGDVCRAKGDHASALRWYQSALRTASRQGHLGDGYALTGMAGSLAASGRLAEAAWYFGAAEAMHESVGQSFEYESMLRQRALACRSRGVTAKSRWRCWGHCTRQATHDPRCRRRAILPNRPKVGRGTIGVPRYSDRRRPGSCR